MVNLRVTGAGTEGTILLTTGSRGTTWYREDRTADMMDALLADGFKLVEVTWDRPGVWQGPAGSVSSACRSATAFEWVHDNVHEQGFFAAQGNSGGSAQIAFSLAYYGLDAILDFANLSSGPVPCPISDDVLNRQDQPQCVIGTPGWDGPREPMLSGNPRLHYPNTIVRFFLGENEPNAYVVETAEAYHRAITSETSLQVVPNAAHSLHRFVEGHVALLTSMREAASRYRSSLSPLLPETTTFTATDDVPYADDGDPDHVMTVYSPDGDGPFPALVVIHGGAWRAGSRLSVQFESRRYARRGIAAFSIDYQLSTPDLPSWPTNIQDVVCAVRHIKENATAYNIDPERVAVLGISAGGHLASLLATLDGNEPFLAGACGNPLTSTRVVLAANYWGAGDLDAYGQSGEGRVLAVEQMVGVSYSEAPEKWLEASPHTYISPDDPPFVIAHGTADAGVPFVTSSSFASQLEAGGVDINFVIVEGADHGEDPLRPNARLVLEPLLRRLLLSSTPASLATTAPTEPPPVEVTGIWRPAMNTSWQWQLSGVPVDQSFDVDMYDIDLFDNGESVVAALHAQGRKVVCYMNAGGWEDWRPDADRFPAEVIGAPLDDWEGERWLDIRKIDALGPLMEARIDLCEARGFDGIEPDNVDGYLNNTGFPLTYEDQLTYNIWFAAAAHKRGLSVGLKNDLEQIPVLLPLFDWALNEQCFQYEECQTLLPFIDAGKPVFHVEYELEAREFCESATALGFNSLKKNWDLDASRQPCE